MSELRPGYFDADGDPITLLEWGRRCQDLAGRTVAETEVRMPDGQVATVRTLWLGIVEPIICCARLFGSAVFYDGPPRGGLFDHVRVYDTKSDAQQGHDEIVALLRAGTRPGTVHSRLRMSEDRPD